MQPCHSIASHRHHHPFKPILSLLYLAFSHLPPAILNLFNFFLLLPVPPLLLISLLLQLKLKHTKPTAAMSLPPRVARTLLRSLLLAARELDQELTRCAGLRARELSQLRAATASALPRELRGLLDIHTTARSKAARTSPLNISTLVSSTIRRITDASQAPSLSHLDASVGFAALRHLHSRLEALRPLVFRTCSATEQHGIHVNVASSFQGADRDRFFFRYQVRIANESGVPVRLLSRAWTIRDLDGRVTDVQGPGVVGMFPTLLRGESYEYSSGVPLATPVGTQSGHYMFLIVGDDGALPTTCTRVHHQHSAMTVGNMLQVPVAPFSHRSPSMDAKLSDAAVPAVEPTTKASRRKRRSNDEGRRR